MTKNTKNLLKSLAPAVLAFLWRNRAQIKTFIDDRKSDIPNPAARF